MAKSITLNIAHLYPDLMDTYGDLGNITTITKRCIWRNIKVDIKHVSVGDNLDYKNVDFFFFGGGQDQAQSVAGTDLAKKQESLRKAAEAGKVLLSVCGGYQLLQNYFKTKDNQKIRGLGIFNAFTEAGDNRMMENLLIKINPKLESKIKSKYKTTINTLIGFENHSGKTYLTNIAESLGTVIRGSGNNGLDHTEGAIYNNFFGCYLHGSLLPKNPHFADFLISTALENKYGSVYLKPLDDSLEWQTHESAVSRTNR